MSDYVLMALKSLLNYFLWQCASAVFSNSSLQLLWYVWYSISHTFILTPSLDLFVFRETVFMRFCVCRLSPLRTILWQREVACLLCRRKYRIFRPSPSCPVFARATSSFICHHQRGVSGVNVLNLKTSYCNCITKALVYWNKCDLVISDCVWKWVLMDMKECWHYQVSVLSLIALNLLFLWPFENIWATFTFRDRLSRDSFPTSA